MNLYGKRYDAKPENLVKVAATKDETGGVVIAPRMQSGSFDALVRAGWVEAIKEERAHPYQRDVKRMVVVGHRLTAEGEKVLANFKPDAGLFKGAHGQKALETFKQMGTSHEDWFHPAVKWVEEERTFIEDVQCPDCFDSRRMGHTNHQAYFTAEDAAKPADDTSVRGFKFPKGPKMLTKTWSGGETQTFKVEGGFYDYTFGEDLRDQYAAANGLVKQPCRHCWRPARTVKARYGRSYREAGASGLVRGPVKRKVMVGYIVWPKGVRFASRFQGENVRKSICQCEICGKGITWSGRIPLAHNKDGKALGMWVGQDCARKFTKVAKLAGPTKTENPRGLESILDVNYEVPEVP